jgi:hypothetical protein
MDTNPQYRQKTDPKVDPNLQYNTEIRWIIGGLIVLALIAAFFLWGGSGTPPQSPTGTSTTEQPATPTQPQGSSQPQQPATPEQPATPKPATPPAPQGGTTGGQGSTNP